MPRIKAFSNAITLRILRGAEQTVSGHAYRSRLGIDVYVWVRGYDGKNVVGLVRLTRRQIEEYLAMLTGEK